MLVLALAMISSGCSHPDARDRTATSSQETTGATPIDPHEPLATVLARHTPALMKIEGVVGTGEGRENGEPVVLVLVRRNAPALADSIPARLDGWKVVVREVGDVTAPPHSR